MFERFVYFVLFVFCISVSYSVITPCYNCSNCSQEIANSNVGDVIELQNYIETNDRCIDFAGKDDIIFDCVNYDNYIKFNESLSSESGFYMVSSANNTVKNCNISSFSNGIHINFNSDYNIINSNLITNSVNNAIQVYNSRHNLFSYNNINNNAETGISSSGADSNIMRDNVINYNNGSGVTASSCFNYSIESNNLVYNDDRGIYLYGVENSTVEFNEISYNDGSGIQMIDSSNNEIKSNILISNSNSGINVRDFSFNNTFSENTIKDNLYNIYFSNYSAIPQNNTFIQNYLGNSTKIRNMYSVWNNTEYSTNIFRSNYYIDFESLPFCFLDGSACDLTASNEPGVVISSSNVLPFSSNLFVVSLIIVGSYLLFF